MKAELTFMGMKQIFFFETYWEAIPKGFQKKTKSPAFSTVWVFFARKLPENLLRQFLGGVSAGFWQVSNYSIPHIMCYSHCCNGVRNSSIKTPLQTPLWTPLWHWVL